MLKKTFVFIAGLIGFAALIAGPLFLIKISQFKAMGAAAAAMVMPPTTVTAMAATPGNWGDTLSATGSVAAVQGVTVASEVPGKIVEIAFESGTAVQAGEILVRLDTTTEEAQLRAAEATAALARANLARARELRASNTNSPAELDAFDAQSKQADAQVESIRTVMAKKTIRAPFAGRLGLRLVNLGQILKDGEAIVTLQNLDPIYVNFSLPQQHFSQLVLGTTVRVTSDALPEEVMEGRITAIAPEVDQATRSLRAQSTITNRGEKLRGGMFARVEVVLPTERPVLTIPATAVVYAPYGDSVFVIDEQKDAQTGEVTRVLRQQFVRLGDARGDFVHVVEGLEPGEMVATSGVFKLRPGMPVVVDNTLAPQPRLNPQPKDA